MDSRNNTYFIRGQIFYFFIVFIILVLLSNISPKIFFGENRELQMLEIMQNITLIFCLVLNFQFRKLFIRLSNLFTFLIRQLFILVLLFEELSFLTSNSNNLNNFQREINLHNSYLMDFQLFSITIPTTNISYTLNIGFFIYFSILFILGYGSYFSFLKNFRYFFLDKQYAIYSFLYFADVVLFSTLSDLNILYFDHINGEVLELFLYLLFFIDTLKKRKIMSEKIEIE